MNREEQYGCSSFGWDILIIYPENFLDTITRPDQVFGGTPLISTTERRFKVETSSVAK